MNFIPIDLCNPGCNIISPKFENLIFFGAIYRPFIPTPCHCPEFSISSA